MRRAALALPLGLILAGCPIPQPLPDYPPGTITPPRIVQESVWPASDRAVIPVGATCPDEPVFKLEAQIFDSNSFEQVSARWFVNYAPIDNSWNWKQESTLAPDPDPTVLTRTVPPFVFRPYNYPPPDGTWPASGAPWKDVGSIRVVELVVSNSFHEPPAEAVPPFRGAAKNFSTQLQRWTFVLVNDPENCGTQTAPLPP